MTTPVPASRRGGFELAPAKVELAQRVSDEKYARGDEFQHTSKLYTLSLVPASPPMKVLDIGCGTGLNAGGIAAKGHEVWGVDISPVAIERFRARGYRGEVCNLGDGLPFSEHSFDLVFSSEVIEHVADTESFLADIFRVLRPGGILVMSTPNSAFWIYRLFGLFGKTVSELQHPGHIRFFSKASLVRLVTHAGFASVEIAARHMYVVVGDSIGRRLAPWLGFAGLRPEFRFRTGTRFWHLSRFAPKASGFWADTLILTARKPAA